MSEKRDGKRRFPRKIAAWPAWVRFHRSARYLKGRTANVSRTGVYITLPVDDEMPEGEKVDFVLGIPTRRDGHYVIQAVNGEATVIRIERGEGFALDFTGEKDIP